MCCWAGKSITLKYFWSEISGGNRSLNRGVVVTKKASTHEFSPEPPISSPYSQSPAACCPFPATPIFITALLPQSWHWHSESKSSAPWHLHFFLTSSKTMNHCDKLLTSEIPSRNIVTNRNSAITSFIALDIMSASSINQTIQDMIRQTLKSLCTLQMCHYMLYLRRTVTNFNIDLLILDDILIFFSCSVVMALFVGRESQ